MKKADYIFHLSGQFILCQSLECDICNGSANRIIRGTQAGLSQKFEVGGLIVGG